MRDLQISISDILYTRFDKIPLRFFINIVLLSVHPIWSFTEVAKTFTTAHDSALSRIHMRLKNVQTKNLQEFFLPFTVSLHMNYFDAILAFVTASTFDCSILYFFLTPNSVKLSL